MIFSDADISKVKSKRVSQTEKTKWEVSEMQFCRTYETRKGITKIMAIGILQELLFMTKKRSFYW